LNTIGQKQIVETTGLFVRPTSSTEHEKPFENITKTIDRKHVGFLKRTVTSDKPSEIIIEEANRGYDLVLMGTDEPAADADYVFGKLVDSVVLQARTRVLVLFEPKPELDRQIKRVLVPVSGSELSLSAAEFGIALAKSLNASVTCLSIVESGSDELYGEATQSGHKIETNISNEIETSLRELAISLDVPFDAVLVQTSSHPAQAAVLTAQQKDIDLIVVGAEPKIGPGLFLGHTINFLLRNAPCAVAVLKLHG
jgi:nucleotide-binding universal stress UspA family protein